MRRLVLTAACAACGGDTHVAPDAGAVAVDAAIAIDAPLDGPPIDGDPMLAEVEPGEQLAVGTATTFDAGKSAFVQPLVGMPGSVRTRYIGGQVMFDVDWIAAPGGAGDTDGLGPVFNAVSCRACHASNGRGAPPLDVDNGGPLVSALARISAPDGSPDPIYGDQLQTRTTGRNDVPAEGTAIQRYTKSAGMYDDGTPYELLIPTVELQLALGDPGPLLVSVRTAPATIGQGFLEAIPADAIAAAADPDDANGDGISGRARWLPTADGPVLGRFGWKAGQPTVAGQNAAALIGDLGITTSLHPFENCTTPQTSCAAAPTGGSPELDDVRLDALRAFVVGTSVPARRNVAGLDVRRGKQVFRDLGCPSCHTPHWQTGPHDFPGIANQTIWPYTDLLLHDLGDGLADHRPEGGATGREWRTPPLWGLGLLQTVNGHQRLLHDGRARGPAEAILWHAGEAAQAAKRFRALSAADRAALAAFLQSL